MTDELPADKLPDLFEAQLGAYMKAHRDAVDEWALRCLRPLDPRLWKTCTLVVHVQRPSDFLLFDADKKLLGTFTQVRKDGQTFFRGLVFAPDAGKPSDTTEDTL